MARIVSVLIMLLVVFSCAPKEIKPEKKEEAKPKVEELVLPEITPIPAEAAPKEAQQAAPKQAEPAFRVEEEGKFIMLNFDGADIETVISTFGELLNINYILAPGVSGKVTIQSYKKVPTKDLFRIFQTILEINGLTAVQDGAFYRIVPIDTAKQHPLDIEKGKETKLRLDSGFVTQLVPFEYVKASEMSNILRSLAPRGTDMIIYEPANLLIVTALPPTLNKFMKLIDALDVSDADRETVRTFVYYVENGEAKKLEGILKSIYAGEKKTTTGTLPAARTTTTPGIPSPVRAAGAEALAGEIGELSITAYEDINALIIKATPRGYLALLELLKKIDVPVKQVLIEVLIAEVSLKDQTDLGLEWLLKGSKASLPSAGGFTQKSFVTKGTDTESVSFVPVLSTGFSAYASGIIDSTLISAAINALATSGNVNVLASPHILAMDNKEATIHIGEEVPIATGTVQQPQTGTGTAFQTSSTIQYKNIGTKLNVTPHITEKNRVTLKIKQEVSELGSSVKIAGQDFQGFSTRTSETTAVVQSGHTIVLGGLIREFKDQSRAGIPWLSKIPLLGYLFSSTTDKYQKTELIVMVTPYVVSSQEEADVLTRDFQNKVKTIKKRLEEAKKEINSETEPIENK